MCSIRLSTIPYQTPEMPGGTGNGQVNSIRMRSPLDIIQTRKKQSGRKRERGPAYHGPTSGARNGPIPGGPLP